MYGTGFEMLNFVRKMLLVVTFFVFCTKIAHTLHTDQIGSPSTDEHPWIWSSSADNTMVSDNLPNFNVRGKRISEIKCLQYTWKFKCQSLLKSVQESCTESLAKLEHSNGPFITTGDRSALPGEYPHVGAVGWKTSSGIWKFKCGSILISPNFVITAAHCTSSESDTSLADTLPKIVRFGHGENIKNVIDVNISRNFVYPRYKSPKKYYDVALMQLEGSVDSIQPACLWSNPDFSVIGSQANLIGYNVITGEDKKSSGLNSALVDIVDLNTCSELLTNQCNRLWCGVQSHQMCAGRLTGGVGSCQIRFGSAFASPEFILKGCKCSDSSAIYQQGDSGGPLQFGFNLSPIVEGIVYYVIGVISFGAGCARPNTPTILSNVTSFLPWIENIVWS